jgi:hypothetical protein
MTTTMRNRTGSSPVFVYRCGSPPGNLTHCPGVTW